MPPFNDERDLLTPASALTLSLLLGRFRHGPAAEHAGPLRDRGAEDDQRQNHHDRRADGENPALGVARGVGADGQRTVVVADVQEAAVERVACRGTPAASTVTQVYCALPMLIRIVVPTASATQPSNWLATPNIGQIVLICPV